MAYDLCDNDKQHRRETSCAKYPAFLKAIEFITSKVPFMPTLGNHESNPRQPYAMKFAVASFPVPGNIHQYSFEVGSVRFQTVNFYDEAVLNNLKHLGQKIRWLHQDFSRKSERVDWVIPFAHYPFYCEKYTNDLGCRTQHYNTALHPFLEYLQQKNVRNSDTRFLFISERIFIFFDATSPLHWKPESEQHRSSKTRQ